MFHFVGAVKEAIECICLIHCFAYILQNCAIPFKKVMRDQSLLAFSGFFAMLGRSVMTIPVIQSDSYMRASLGGKVYDEVQ